MARTAAPLPFAQMRQASQVAAAEPTAVVVIRGEGDKLAARTLKALLHALHNKARRRSLKRPRPAVAFRAVRWAGNGFRAKASSNQLCQGRRRVPRRRVVTPKGDRQEQEAGGGRETGSSVLCQARLVQHLESSSLGGAVTRGLPQAVTAAAGSVVTVVFGGSSYSLSTVRQSYLDFRYSQRTRQTG